MAPGPPADKIGMAAETSSRENQFLDVSHPSPTVSASLFLWALEKGTRRASHRPEERPPAILCILEGLCL